MKQQIKYLLILILLGIFAWISIIKIQALNNWLFSSDLYSYDTLLQETLKGNFAVEYTYATLFGDHAYFSFLLFLPIKIFLAKNFVYLLVLITPICYVACGITIIKYLGRHNLPVIYLIVLVLCYLFHLELFIGNYEGLYGFHVDTASGYLLVIIAILMIGAGKGKGFKYIELFLILFFLFMKEEMAIIGVVYFSILWMTTKQKKYLMWGLIACAIFLIELGAIHYFKTPFNRGNGIILQGFYTNLREHGITFLFTAPSIKQFWNYIFLFVGIYGLLVYFNKFNPFALALFVSGIIKTSFSFSIGDYTFNTWHGFPALIMFTGAIIIQATEPSKAKFIKYKLSIICTSVFFIISAVSLNPQYKQLCSTRGCIHYNRNYRQIVENDLKVAKLFIEKNKVVALNTFVTKEFTDGYRYSFFSRGVDMLPSGIADYVLVDKENGEVKPLSKSPIFEPTQTVLNEFVLTFQNSSFAVYKRIKHSLLPDRQWFIDYCGKKSLGE
jgi:hypothetical protein